MFLPLRMTHVHFLGDLQGEAAKPRYIHIHGVQSLVQLEGHLAHGHLKLRVLEKALVPQSEGSCLSIAKSGLSEQRIAARLLGGSQIPPRALVQLLEATQQRFSLRTSCPFLKGPRTQKQEFMDIDLWESALGRLWLT